MAKHALPPHIRQLVDKNNFVIAIKTLSQEQGISLEDAKAQIDAYEASKAKPNLNAEAALKSASAPNLHPDNLARQNGGERLLSSVETHIQQQNIPRSILPYWVKRVLVLLLIIGILSWLMWRTFT